MLLFELDNYVSGNVVYNDTLNPKIYDADGNMRPEVHKALMAVSDNFIEDLDLPDMVIHDIILTGSSANYNWTKYSDIDLHLISDVDIFADPHMAERYFKAAKNVWNNLHDVEIRGLDVEVYVEDNDEVNESLGRFSVLNNEWISKPVHNRPVFDEDAVNRKVRYLMKEIDHVMDSNDPTEIEHIKSKLWNMRNAALARAGEFSVENLAFKVLRNMGYAQKILDAIRGAEDDEMSIRESDRSKPFELITYEVDGEVHIAGYDNLKSAIAHGRDGMKHGDSGFQVTSGDAIQHEEGLTESEGGVYKCGWCGNETDADGNPTGKPGRKVLGFTKKVQGKCCPGGSRDHQSQQGHEDEMRINEVEGADPESALGKTAHSHRGGVTYSGQIRKVIQIQGEWFGIAAFYNDSNPDTNKFRVKLDPETFEPLEFDDHRNEWI